MSSNIAKGTTDPRVEFNLPKFKQAQTQILIKFRLQNLDMHQLQNLNLTSAPRLNLQIKILTKIQLQTSKKTSVAKY